tara:strand:- start:6 stop:209 length:204 start_codon:yes stop_codon:yes gene_type:complete
MIVYILFVFLNTNFLLMALILAKPAPVAKPQSDVRNTISDIYHKCQNQVQKRDDLQTMSLPWHDIFS